MKRAPRSSRHERPLIGVTTSEVRRAERVTPLPEGEPRGKEMALGMPYLRGVEAAGGLPVVMPPLDERRDRAAARPPRRDLPLRRPRPRPGALRRRAPPRAGPDRARPRPLRAGDRASRRRPRDADPGDLPRHPGAQHHPRRHPPPAHPRPLDEIAHRQTQPRRPAQPRGRGRPRAAASPRSSASERARDSTTSTPSTTRRSTGSATGCGSAPAPPTARSRRSRTPTAAS